MRRKAVLHHCGASRPHHLFLLALLLFGSCALQDVDERADAGKDSPDIVTFDTYMQRSGEQTRATLPTGGAGAMDDDKLKTTGFGVFAQYTEASTFAPSTTAGTTPYNFMWNQLVQWNTGSGSWTYQPVKYWPNDNTPADDQDNDTGSDPATGSKVHDYVSFFAYAPWADHTKLPGTITEGTGIISMTANGEEATDSHLTYKMTDSFTLDDNVDLLWASQTDRYKTDGGGTTTGKVQFLFLHALSQFTITVQGLFNHVDNDDTSPNYPEDRDLYTHILVEKVDFQSSPLFRQGDMYFVPLATTPDVPRWENLSTKGSINIGGSAINESLSNSYLGEGEWKSYWNEDKKEESFLQLSDINEDGVTDAEDALLLFNQLPIGVSHTEVPLLYTPSGTERYYTVIPNKGEVTDDNPMKIRMVYYVITYDPRLTLPKDGYPKYFSIVKNDITATFSTAFAFEPNMKYKLRLMPGLTTVKFEVTAVDGWDTPITLNPEVVDWYTKTLEYDVK